MSVDAIATPEVAPAGFWIRALARVIDWVMVVTGFVIGFLNLCVGTGFVAAFTKSGVNGTWIDYIDRETWVSWTATLGAFAVYHAVAEGVLGTTVGKRVMGLRVVTLELRPPTFRQALARSAGFFIDGFLFFLVAAQAMRESPIRQRVGDKWGNTRVVYQRTLPDPRWPGRVLFAGVMIAALLAAGRLFAIGEYLSFLWIKGR